MNYDIKFDSHNILFVGITEALLDDYMEMVNNSEISKYISLKDRVFSKDDEKNWINDKIQNKKVIFSMLEKNTGKFIGNIELMSIEKNIGELGICLTAKMQNKHYGYEAIKRFIDYCFEDLNLEGIALSVYSHNDRAKHLYKKLGFVEYKVEKNVGVYDGQKIDDIYMKYIK